MLFGKIHAARGEGAIFVIIMDFTSTSQKINIVKITHKTPTLENFESYFEALPPIQPS